MSCVGVQKVRRINPWEANLLNLPSSAREGIGPNNLETFFEINMTNTSFILSRSHGIT